MTVSELDRWRATQQLVEHHSEGAEMEAAGRADAAIAEGDAKGESHWLDVLKKIRFLQRTDPIANELN